jgi:hypothetical protein
MNQQKRPQSRPRSSQVADCNQRKQFSGKLVLFHVKSSKAVTVPGITFSGGFWLQHSGLIT